MVAEMSPESVIKIENKIIVKACLVRIKAEIIKKNNWRNRLPKKKRKNRW